MKGSRCSFPGDRRALKSLVRVQAKLDSVKGGVPAKPCLACPCSDGQARYHTQHGHAGSGPVAHRMQKRAASAGRQSGWLSAPIWVKGSTSIFSVASPPSTAAETHARPGALRAASCVLCCSHHLARGSH